MAPCTEGTAKKVCVTGASGYVASWLIKLLLDRGYTVNATVRDLKDPEKTQHLLALDGAKERLHLFEANLVDEGSFDSAILGCDGVFHTASPMMKDSENPQEEIIDPALKGTLNVLKSCAKVPSVRRVVYTSSIATVLYNGRTLTEKTVVDETWFSTPECCKKLPVRSWYMLSKTLAEDAAWSFCKENGLDMVSINPAGIIGAHLQTRLDQITGFLVALFNGSLKEVPANTANGWVHVKDVAEAHIRAFEIPSANGRYILSERVIQVSEFLDMIRELYPHVKLPSVCEDGKSSEPAYQYSKDKVTTSLGLEYIPLEVALKETVESLQEMKYISLS